MALLLKIFIESTRKASLSFREGDKQYVQDLHGCRHRPRRACHLLKTPLGYYSQKCRTPLPLARAHRWRSMKMFPASYCSLDRLFLTKTLPFLLRYTPANQHDKRVEVLLVCLGHPLTRSHPPLFHLFMPIGYQLQRYPYLGKAFEPDLSGIDALCKDVIHHVLLLITQEA